MYLSNLNAQTLCGFLRQLLVERGDFGHDQSALHGSVDNAVAVARAAGLLVHELVDEADLFGQVAAHVSHQVEKVIRAKRLATSGLHW